MKTTFISLFVCAFILNIGQAQILKVDTLQLKGDKNKYINFVIMGDGYTLAEQTKFISDANSLTGYLFNQSPWSNYRNFFNVFAIRVISTVSGAKHPNTASDCNTASPLVPTSTTNTYFGSTFDYGGIHRLLVPTNNGNIANVLSSNFPNYDQVFIITNTPYYGGSGGQYATASANTSSNEIMAHETGHSFAYLADEYYAGDSYAMEKPNMTKQTNTSLVKWKNWMGINGIGINQHCCGGNSSLWYKPYTSCKMQYLGYAYCSVCKETIIEKIHSLVNPIVSYTPTTSGINTGSQLIDFKLTELMKPVSNTLKIQWKLDGNVIYRNVENIQVDQNALSNGNHTLTVTVIDTTSLLKVDNHASVHFSNVTWTINKTVTELKLLSAENKISYSLYPNPSSETLNLEITTEKQGEISLQIIDTEGKTIRQISEFIPSIGKYSKQLSVSNWKSGQYFAIFKLGDAIHAQPFIKE